jgi:3-oxoacyl-[acyl-carrier protein] reductase
MGQGNSLEGKVALVTGGHKGIGLAIVKSFLREGARVIFTGRNAEQMKQVYERLDTKNVSYMQWNISDTENNEELMRQAFDIYGTIDILVNNAGVVTKNNNIFVRKSFLEINDEDVVYIHSINVLGTIMICRAYSKLIKNNNGKILNVISNTAFSSRRLNDAYALSKLALLSYTLALQNQYDNIIVNGIAPGRIKTEMSWRHGSPIMWEATANLRIGLPEEIAELAVMLAGKSGDLISGKVFLCDGGEVLK